MRRSKYGYLLLALLVITGLAGTLTSASINNKERKFAAAHLKDSRNELAKTLKALSSRQLDFKLSPSQGSIRQCVYQLAFSERDLWDRLQTALKQPANPEKRVLIKWTDNHVIEAVADELTRSRSCEKVHVKTVKFGSLTEALASFESRRAEHIKYINSTTEDLRNHVVEMPFGWLDCYQVCLAMSSLSDGCLRQIAEIRSAPGFPAR
jgi:DinB superfamily